MKCLCITGATQAGIESVASLLQQAGMQAPLPLTRDTPIDITAWHEQVMDCAREAEVLGFESGQATDAEKGDGHFAPVSSPGRLWEQLASDIFLANLKTPLWGWSHISSTWLLDYWRAFEPRLNYVLVCQTPEQMLASALATDTPLADIDALMHAWHAWHQHMLRFYNRNPRRCLLVNAADCVQNPAAFVERCVGQWKLPLTSPEQFVAVEALQTPLSLHLARQIARSYPQTGSLQQELDATLTRLDPTATISFAPLDDAAALLEDYRQMREQTQLLQQEINQLKQAASGGNLQTPAQQAATSGNDMQASLREAEQENELLLLQLHQVQEELEHYFLQHQDTQKQMQTMQAKMDRLLQRSPGYIDYAAVEILDADDSGSTTWRIKHLDAGSRTFDELQFRTVVQHGMAGLVLRRESGTSAPLLRWPAAAAHLDELTILTVGSRSDIQLRMQILLDLGTRDWDLLRTLTRLLGKLLAQPAALNAPATFAPDPLREGLDKLAQFFTAFPDTLRYDQVSLKREQVNPDYEHLWLRFDNLAYGTQHWPHFEFRLSCAGIRPGQFGNHPKLEFPADAGANPLESWFDESSDDFGAKLELRFALPDAMDVGIWKRLSAHDQRLLKSLIERLPAILTTLQSAGTYINRPWNDWQKLAADILRITNASTAPPAAAPRAAGGPETRSNESGSQHPAEATTNPTGPRQVASRTKGGSQHLAETTANGSGPRHTAPRRTGESRYPDEKTAGAAVTKLKSNTIASKVKIKKANKAEQAG